MSEFADVFYQNEVYAKQVQHLESCLTNERSSQMEWKSKVSFLEAELCKAGGSAFDKDQLRQDVSKEQDLLRQERGTLKLESHCPV